MYLIIGGTGRAGRLAVQMLIDAGKPVRLLVRDLEKARAMGLGKVELVRGDVTRPETLSPAFEGVTGVFSALNVLNPGTVHLLEAVEYEGNRHIIKAAKQANARFVYLSVFAAGEVTFPHFAVKARVERLAREIGVPFTFLRPVTWTESLLMGMQNGNGQVIGRQTNRQQFISALDVARTAVTALDDGPWTGQALDLLGPEALTFDEAYHKLGLAWKGGPISARHAPVWMMRFFAALAARKDGGYLRDLTAMYALYDSLTEKLGDPEPAQRVLGFEFLSVEAVGRKLRDGSLDPAIFLPQ